MNGEDQFLGTVEKGQFHPIVRSTLGKLARLTSIHRQEARTPESGELDLVAYEGRAIMVQGYHEGEWIFEAKVVDQAGPILTQVVQQVFGTAS